MSRVDRSQRGVGGGGAYPETVERLLAELTRLPGIGRRSAERIGFHLLRSSADDALRLAEAVRDVKSLVRHCGVCFSFSEGESCSVCDDARRERSEVLVVEQPRDLIAIEQSGMFRGVYHVLMGRLSPLEGVEPEHLTIDRLLGRVRASERNSGGVAVREVILGLSPTLEGDGTSLHVAALLSREPRVLGGEVRVTRLARGLPTGRELEFATKPVLAEAIAGRKPMEG